MEPDFSTRQTHKRLLSVVARVNAKHLESSQRDTVPCEEREFIYNSSAAYQALWNMAMDALLVLDHEMEKHKHGESEDRLILVMTSMVIVACEDDECRYCGTREVFELREEHKYWIAPKEEELVQWWPVGEHPGCYLRKLFALWPERVLLSSPTEAEEFSALLKECEQIVDDYAVGRYILMFED